MPEFAKFLFQAVGFLDVAPVLFFRKLQRVYKTAARSRGSTLALVYVNYCLSR